MIDLTLKNKLYSLINYEKYHMRNIENYEIVYSHVH